MKRIVQAERTGCGIASVAAIAGVTYQRARAVALAFGISANDRSLWSGTGHVRRLLSSFGAEIPFATKAFRSWESLPDCALLAIKWRLEEGRPCWHWVVFVREPDRSYVLDSNPRLKTSTRTDFGRMKPRWFLAVRPPHSSHLHNRIPSHRTLGALYEAVE